MINNSDITILLNPSCYIAYSYSSFYVYNDNISAIAVAPGNSNIVWVGHNNGYVYSTTNGTATSPTWTAVDTNALTLPNRYVTRITIDPHNHNTVYVAFGGFSSDNLWKSTDGGATWADTIGTGLTALPDAPVRDLDIHPDNSNWLYASTEVGIFTSEDGGATWKLPHDGPANVSVDESFWMDRDLIAVTHGLGVFRASAGSPPQADAGNNQIVAISATVTLNGSASSDPDGHYPLSYRWAQSGGPAACFTPDLSVTTFIAPPSETVLTFTLGVTDSSGMSDSVPDEVVITVGATIFHIYLPLVLRQQVVLKK